MIEILFTTLKHLKPSQIFWQFFYRLKPKSVLKTKNRELKIVEVPFHFYPVQYSKYKGHNHFCFLNLEKQFASTIDWKYEEYGKLWNYNLEYFDYLQQEDINVKSRVDLLKDFYTFSIEHAKVLEPYPVSLRLINSIKFLSRYNISDRFILNCLHQEGQFLFKNLEYHILGNHLLENGFALLLAGYYFNEKLWVQKGEEILSVELKEQIHQDGAHFELSPMYHQIILFRVLELIDWYTTYGKNPSFLIFVNEIVSRMLSFLEHISFENGDIPHFNDSATGIAYTTKELVEYAKILGVSSCELPLSDSGYRSLMNNNFEIKIDVAQLAVDYQPGHAHADSLGFIMYYNKQPFLIEQGTSTYQINDRRALERSSSAHNTVTIHQRNHSNVWSGFRVAERAKTFIIEDHVNVIKAKHNGYVKPFSTWHERHFKIDQKQFSIDDMLSSTQEGESHLHFAHGITPLLDGHLIRFKEIPVVIEVKNCSKILFEDYLQANGYNQYLKNRKALIRFTQHTTLIFQS
ncbi:heparinase II/III domain-containing protein [Empedobacter falsenii]|uniref:heparinase II/III domain-containing protein n=1 Tax=Empedobacter falsenii TaxID=343874 RepID=UPI003A80ED91